MSQSKVCGETVSDEQTARRRPVPVREPSGKASAAPAQANRPCLVSRSFVIVAESSCLPVECLFECAQFVVREHTGRASRRDCPTPVGLDCWVFFGQCLFVFQAAFFRSRKSLSTSFGVRYPRAE